MKSQTEGVTYLFSLYKYVNFKSRLEKKTTTPHKAHSLQLISDGEESFFSNGEGKQKEIAYIFILTLR